MKITIDANLAEQLDFETAYERIMYFRTETFVFTPQYNNIFRYCKKSLIHSLQKEIRGGKVEINIPLYLPVPKKQPPYHRKGGFLFPKEELLYQALVDSLLTEFSEAIDKHRVFNHRIMNVKGTDDLFESSSGYEKMQKRFRKIVEQGYKFVIKTDLVSYYSNINLHELENNLLADIPHQEKTIKALNRLLISLVESSSKGLVQGIFASDLLANYYLSFIEDYAEDIPSTRYMDDLYFFFKYEEEAHRRFYDIEFYLLDKGLYLNENKTKIFPSHELIREEDYVDELFKKAKEEVEEYLDLHHSLLGGTYEGMILNWELDQIEEPEDEYIELEAVKKLFDCEIDDISKKNKVDEFCLHKLSLVCDSFACDYVLTNFTEDHPNSKAFSNYIWMTLITEKSAHTKILATIQNNYINMLFYAKLWLLVSLIQYNENDLKLTQYFINAVMDDFKDKNNPEILRGFCAIFCLKYGTGSNKTYIRSQYHKNSEYIKTAIYWATKEFIKGDNKRITLRDWRHDSIYNEMIFKIKK